MSFDYWTNFFRRMKIMSLPENAALAPPDISSEPQSEPLPPVQPVPVPSVPSKDVADALKTATSVVTTAAAISQVVAPGAAQQPIGGVEASVLGIEESARQVMNVIPGASAFSAFVLPAEVATHLGFAVFHFFKAMTHPKLQSAVSDAKKA
jgi:hypothetical protein